MQLKLSETQSVQEVPTRHVVALAKGVERYGMALSRHLNVCAFGVLGLRWPQCDGRCQWPKLAEQSAAVGLFTLASKVTVSHAGTLDCATENVWC